MVEIGSTWLAVSAQRTWCNTEAKYLLLSHALDVWKVHRVALKTDERNARSRRAIERLGARFEGVRRADMPGQDGSVRSSAYYSIPARRYARAPDGRPARRQQFRYFGLTSGLTLPSCAHVRRARPTRSRP